jgi:hypothetical protein
MHQVSSTLRESPLTAAYTKARRHAASNLRRRNLISLVAALPLNPIFAIGAKSEKLV